jgi:hypothetical protein
MDASDLIKTLQITLRGGGRPHMGLGQVARDAIKPACKKTRNPSKSTSRTTAPDRRSFSSMAGR